MSKISYLKAADGREIGVVDNRIAFVMDEVEDGLFIVKSSESFDIEKGWHNFFSAYADNPIRTKQEFYKFVMDCEEHLDEVSKFNRITFERIEADTPWGTAISRTHFGNDIYHYTTGIAFGFHVPEALNATIPEALRIADGWYADMSDDCRMVIGLPDHFTAVERKQALKELEREHPELWQAYNELLETEENSQPKI